MKIFSKYLSLVVLALLFASTFSVSIIFVSFTLNRDYIVKELCVNRFEQESACHGKCYLKKQITQEESEESGNDMNIQQLLNWLITPFDDYPFLSDSLSIIRHEHNERLPIGPVMTTDRPPPFQS